MRAVIETIADTLPLPSPADRLEATKHWGQQEANDRFQSQWPCLNTIEYSAPNQSAIKPETLTVTAWNMERCKWGEQSAKLLTMAGADIVLATEMDWGMARSGQRHTTRELAARLGFAYAFGVEFVELGLGDARETESCAGMSNEHGLHGNAILSRWPLTDIALIPLDAGGYWFLQAPKNDGQYRVGGRNAIAAKIATPKGELLLVAVHYESESDVQGRALQSAHLLNTLNTLYGSLPTVIGGDLNTRGFLQAGLTGIAMLEHPEEVETSFTHFAQHGFDWQASNTGQETTRLHPYHDPQQPLKTLDWLFTRDVDAIDPFVLPALADDITLSDHELIGVTIRP